MQLLITKTVHINDLGFFSSLCFVSELYHRHLKVHCRVGGLGTEQKVCHVNKHSDVI